ncbi:50S ribosomal protein L25 [Serpentinicella sp. ANB-PHB4]|uniref:50S ribosomal protein L25 n=1 Tax=Serpentinicella sp. ANB-PHB4 TaxID=3074076 RepID=UPI00285FD49A|nr:50S ribosomal protein L25 [Serpentinicella sp. ANB-PHB4]MDR5660087.1 50S ribosomal protein L25 [Serpentinicella sp. ANB-PHB4]
MENVISSSIRNDVGKNSSYRMKEQGYVPGVLYGKGIKTIHVQVERGYLETLIRDHGINTIVTLNVEGQTYNAFLKEVQRDPVTKEILHVDYQHVNHNQEIHVSIPVILRGKKQVEKSGIILQQQLKEIDIKCATENIPKRVECDISNFSIGDSLRVADLEISKEISIVSDLQSVIASVTALRGEKSLEEE